MAPDSNEFEFYQTTATTMQDVDTSNITSVDNPFATQTSVASLTNTATMNYLKTELSEIEDTIQDHYNQMYTLNGTKNISEGYYYKMDKQSTYQNLATTQCNDCCSNDYITPYEASNAEITVDWSNVPCCYFVECK